jgi:hypothetical protein
LLDQRLLLQRLVVLRMHRHSKTQSEGTSQNG